MVFNVLMILSFVLIATPSFAAKNAQQPSTPEIQNQAAGSICQMEAGDTGLIKYKGSSYEEAYQKVADACFAKRNTDYIMSRQEQPDQDRQIQFVESCVNNIQCS